MYAFTHSQKNWPNPLGTALITDLGMIIPLAVKTFTWSDYFTRIKQS